MEIFLIRHGMTPGNASGRYVGRTDEALSNAGRDRLKEMKAAGAYGDGMESVARVYISPMKRCQETAAILFPGVALLAENDFRECDFGDFEYKNYKELNGNPHYQAWIDGGGRGAFPGGESREHFCERVTAAFDRIVTADFERMAAQTSDSGKMALVAHGGTLMAILDAYASPHKDYFEWQAKNGCGYVVELDGEQWAAGHKSLKVMGGLVKPERLNSRSSTRSANEVPGAVDGGDGRKRP